MSASYPAGNQVYLRGLQLQDVGDRYYSWLNDPEINQYLETRFLLQSKEVISDFVRSKQGSTNEFLWAICEKENNRHIGNIKLGPINWYHRFADISLFIGEKDCWFKGYSSESISLVVDFSFNTLNLHKVKAGAYAQNIGSIKSFEKNGFIREGLLKNHFFSNGSYVDAVLLGLSRENYKPNS
ncbi:GNAT family N-acetyltransferase [Leptospira terpstrae]|uniref:GNAT family N-acetyltransferase n=1 Tax=Leptospira terpstrae TaxID=293075 RepID=UPI003D04D41A